MTTVAPIQKCRCASRTHEHQPGKCTNLATELESLCKPCYDKTSEELRTQGSTDTAMDLSARERSILKKIGPDWRPTPIRPWTKNEKALIERAYIETRFPIGTETVPMWRITEKGRAVLRATPDKAM
jgi:hypothetical protein